MAYGMRPQELAAVGRNINQQGVGVDESSIQEAMDAELDEERAETVARNKARQNKARIADAETKASIKQRGMDALKTIAVVRFPGSTCASVAPGTNTLSSCVGPGNDKVARFTVSGTLTIS